jgi:hypothetical protein
VRDLLDRFVSPLRERLHLIVKGGSSHDELGQVLPAPDVVIFVGRDEPYADAFDHDAVGVQARPPAARPW